MTTIDLITDLFCRIDDRLHAVPKSVVSTQAALKRLNSSHDFATLPDPS